MTVRSPKVRGGLLLALITVFSQGLVLAQGPGDPPCERVETSILQRLTGDWLVDWTYRKRPGEYFESRARATWTPAMLGCALEEQFSGSIDGTPFESITMITISSDGSLNRMTVDSQHGGFNKSNGEASGDSVVFAWSRDFGDRVMRTRHVFYVPEYRTPSFRFYLARSEDEPWQLVEAGQYVRPTDLAGGDMLTASPDGIFWNTHSGRFIYPPAFDLPGRSTADLYRFTLRSLTDGTANVFFAANPSASLGPVWDVLPEDSLLLLVEAYAGKDETVPVAERRLIKSHRFESQKSEVGSLKLEVRSEKVEVGSLKLEVRSEKVEVGSQNETKEDSAMYRDAGFRSLDALYKSQRIQHWLEAGEPNPEYPLWVYPAKVMGATIRAMVNYSRMTEDRKDSENAAQVAEMIADFMLNLREPEGSPLAGFPPVHWRGVEPENHPVYEGEYMVQFPAEAAWALLDLYDFTSKEKYLAAVLAIADRYVATQRDDGTWFLLLMAETGQPGRRKNPVVPTYMIELFDRLNNQYQIDAYAESRQRATEWIMRNPVTTFAWEAQFEDTRPKPSLQNLAYREAAHTAKLLFGDPSTVATAELVLRFVEDQFVVWHPGDPMLFRDWFSAKNSQWNGNDQETGKDWFLPAVLEQYAFYTPIAGAAATVMDVYVTAHRATGDDLYQEKAVAIANSILAAQEYHGGGEIPTHMRRTLPEKNWTNVGVHAALKLIEHNDVLVSNIRSDHPLE